ncbi:hypothetical protein GXW82_10630 [Streptacidiphilus sp. 4-A2]|nr:hypothetical protein [Streptacidiphilus sp. 4-A2]
MGGNTLGYSILVNADADLPATFPPTGLWFVTNQYRGGADGRTLQPDLDTVNYLMMTGGKPFPANLQPWWGNLVVPDDAKDGWYGTIAVADPLIVKDFLLARLAPLVLAHWQLRDQDGSLAPEYTEVVGTFTPTALGGTWTSGPQTSRSHVTNSFSNDDVDYAMTVSVDLAVTPGSNEIVIKRTTDFDVHYTHWYGIDGHALSTEYHVWYDVPLTITVQLLGVQDGKLQVAVTSVTREPEPHTAYAEPYGWDITRSEGDSSIWLSVQDTLDAAVDGAVEMAVPKALLTGIETAIAQDLNLKPFVFPGSAQLFMANPLFSAEGDLLLGLQYKV